MILIGALVCASSAQAAEYLETVQAPPAEAPGDRAAITKRAAGCLARNLRPERAGPAVIQSTDPETGVTVAAASFPYSRGGVPWTARSTVTVEAKDGRFRITQSNLEHRQGAETTTAAASFLGTNRQGGDWMRVGLWWGSGGDAVRKQAEALNLRLAACVTAQDDW